MSVDVPCPSTWFNAEHLLLLGTSPVRELLKIANLRKTSYEFLFFIYTAAQIRNTNSSISSYQTFMFVKGFLHSSLVTADAFCNFQQCFDIRKPWIYKTFVLFRQFKLARGIEASDPPLAYKFENINLRCFQTISYSLFISA